METHWPSLLSRVVVATIGLAAMAVVIAVPADAAVIGGVDMQRACTVQNPGMGLAAVVTDAHNAYSWRCRAPWGYQVGINVNAACTDQYGGGAYATVLNAADPYSWRCNR
ncbi:hypothetical protein MUY14_42340 [Amycolatopsis sp. FBCC-B4732]|uniref:hypothetical protein n=1 Tax=Amycolatopsis sp. FBCC-B4732 TaxID=3079339 RepID=UPI001FF11C2B|nr:hypothetical protein [Amycolatopsis sp. FBCC-B4732]UOX88262.1 hypothetical protein MUY14_42340 [Amycolatopsis sp. FBCC-B4732]